MKSLSLVIHPGPSAAPSAGEENLLSHVLEINHAYRDEERLAALSGNPSLLRPHVEPLAAKLGLEPMEAILFSWILFTQDDRPVTLGQVASGLSVPRLALLQYGTELDALQKKRLIRMYRGKPSGDAESETPDTGMARYFVPQAVVDALSRNQGWAPPDCRCADENAFFEALDNLFEQRITGEISAASLTAEAMELLKENKHLDAAQKIAALRLPPADTMLLLMFCNQAADGERKIHAADMELLEERRYCAMRLWRSLTEEYNTLLDLKLVEPSCADGMGDIRSFELTQKAKDDFLGGLLSEHGAEISVKRKTKGLLLWDTIKPRKLVYDHETCEKVERLQSLLDDTRYGEIKTRLEESNMRLGFACLFSGGPGTGKTETVLQLARNTRRDIMKVDISNTKTKWFGESERLIKDVFDRYRGLVADSAKKQYPCPILFFNEADAVFSKRMTLGEDRRGPGQTENAIQNIILDEMENLSGILIATTNLTLNMDSAFERRFLYKIDFPRPDKVSRAAIWKSMIADLDEKEAALLADEYQFSGGEIENIARKRAIDTALNGKAPTTDEMLALCREENIAKGAEKRIGFGV